GTTADIGIIVGGKPLTSVEGQVLKYPIRIPMIDVVSIGAGGGSIAWLDEASSLHVGPQSAGAVPGPACYGKGGTEPTVTDASIVLGYLNPDYFAGGDVPLDPDAAHRALETMGARLGMSKVRVAHGIHTILNNRMADQIRLLTISRGHDPRDFALVVLGGAGPLHGSPLARALRMPRVIVPFAPGVLSAFGLLVSDVEHDQSITFRHLAEQDALPALVEAFAKLDKSGGKQMQRETVSDEEVGVRRYAEMRYVGQSYELEIPIDAHFDEALVPALIEAFHETHERIYRQHSETAKIEFVNLRTVHFARLPKLQPTPPKPGPSWKEAQSGTRRIYLADKDENTEVPVYRRDLLPIDTECTGPFIIEQADTTTVVLPGETARLERHGNLIVSIGRDG
ncbi:MAG: hydantoinase/oxoprolinase family protein, partial [Hyphomicrobiales bacterium]|nr:hydantoinase/oxoprolinase family protein [Hyphomicrobiales bacterium]